MKKMLFVFILVTASNVFAADNDDYVEFSRLEPYLPNNYDELPKVERAAAYARAKEDALLNRRIERERQRQIRLYGDYIRLSDED